MTQKLNLLELVKKNKLQMRFYGNLVMHNKEKEKEVLKTIKIATNKTLLKAHLTNSNKIEKIVEYKLIHLITEQLKIINRNTCNNINDLTPHYVRNHQTSAFIITQCTNNSSLFK